MDYEAQMEKQAKQKKRKQFFVMIFLIALLLVGGYYLYQWKLDNGEEKFRQMAQKTLDSVYENYKNDKMFDDSLEDKTYTFPNKDVLNFDERSLKGGTIIQYSDGEVALAIYDSTWCAKKEKGSSNIVVIEYEDGKCNLE